MKKDPGPFHLLNKKNFPPLLFLEPKAADISSCIAAWTVMQIVTDNILEHSGKGFHYFEYFKE